MMKILHANCDIFWREKTVYFLLTKNLANSNDDNNKNLNPGKCIFKEIGPKLIRWPN